MSNGEFKSSVTSDAFWLRTLFTVLFFIVVRILDLILLIAAIVQWVSRLFNGEVNSSVNRFCLALGVYYQQVVHYVTGATEEKPFPFQDWPAETTTPSPVATENDDTA